MKNNWIHGVLRVAALLCFYLGMVAPAAAETRPIVVCYPGGPVNEAEANSAMGAMLKVVERVGEWPEGRFESFFTASLDECRQLLQQKKPSFAILSLGLFLEQRTAHQLMPLVQPQMKGATSERYRLVTRKGRFTRLDELKGKTVGGTVFVEPDFMQKIVFANRFDPRTHFDLRPSRQAIRALRALDRGELEGVVLNGQQYAALGALPLQNPLEPLFTSEEIPLMGLVANRETSTEEDRSRFVRALTGMCTDTEGRKLCDLFGVEAFVSARVAAIEPMIELWEGSRR